MGRKPRVILFLSLGFALFLGCANPVMPTGGPTDTRPPALLKSNPDTFAVQVNSPILTLTFDEWIDLKDAERQVRLSPPQKNPPQISLRGKSVVLTLNDSLRPNTTYQVNFGTAIRDITEGNVAKELELVFSTGPALDSAWMERVIIDAQTGRPIPAALLMAYKNKISTDSHSAAPDFLAYSDSSGRARLRFLPSLPLHLMGLKEPSPDFRYNRPAAEWVGFEATPATPYSSDTLWLFKEESDSMYFTLAKELHAGKWALKLSRPATEIYLLNPTEDLPGLRVQRPPGNGDSLLLWIAEFKRTDSLNLVFSIDGIGVHRTIYPSARPNPPRPKTPVLQDPVQNPMPVRWDRPLSKINPQGLRLITGKDTLRPISQLHEGVLWINLDITPSKPSRLTWDSTAIFDVFGQAIPAGELKMEPRDFVEWTLEFPEQEKSSSLLVWAEQEGKSTIRIPFKFQKGGAMAKATLPPGQYRLLKTHDQNQDGRWTPGKWKTRLFPEKTRRTTKVFELKSGFDVQTRWE